MGIDPYRIAHVTHDTCTNFPSFKVGLWYMGFLISAGFIFILSIALMTFPQELAHSIPNETNEKRKQSTVSGKTKEAPLQVCLFKIVLKIS